MIRPVLIALLAVAAMQAADPATAAPAAQAVGPNWYRVQIDGGWDEKTSTFNGTSSLSLNAMVALIGEGKPIRLDHLVVVEEGQAPVAWKDLDPAVKGVVVIPAGKVVTIMPLVGDPRQAVVEDPPKSEPADPGKM